MDTARCKNFDKYRAERPPRCNGGRPCSACKAKWEARNRAGARRSAQFARSAK